MKKLMPLAASIALILVASLFATAGTMTLFSDTETSEGNIGTAGTLDLKVGMSDLRDDPIAHATLVNLKPGDYCCSDGNPASCRHESDEHLVFTVKNDGSIDGNFWIEIVNIVNYENGQNEPESLVDSTTGDEEGELGQGVHMYFAYYINGNWKSCGSGIDELSRGVKNVLKPLEPDQEATICIGWNLKNKGPAIDNKIQSDSLEFDIIFHLDQA